MAWNNEMVRILRYLINDIDAVSYSDSRLEETLIVAAQLICMEVDFDNSYTIDVDCLTLTPDPTTSPKDNGFINLVCLKACCIVRGSEYKTASLNGVLVTDGPSTIDARGLTSNAAAIYKDICDKFEHAKIQYQAGNSRAGQAVLTPYTVPFLPSSTFGD